MKVEKRKVEVWRWDVEVERREMEVERRGVEVGRRREEVGSIVVDVECIEDEDELWREVEGIKN